MKSLNLEQMENVKGGGNGPCVIEGIIGVGVGLLTGGLLAPLIIAGAAAHLIQC